MAPVLRVVRGAACCVLLGACGDGGTVVAPSAPPAVVAPAADPAAAALLADMERLFAGNPRFAASSATPPYVVVVEAGPDAEETLARRGAALADLRRTFLAWADAAGLKPRPGPLPVLCFRTRAGFDAYARARGREPDPAVLAEYEWDTGRLVLHDGVDAATLRHEAAHQLAFAAARRPTPFVPRDYFPQQSLGLHEGLAEWIAGATVEVDAAGAPRLRGTVDPDRLRAAFAAVPEERRYDVRGLVDLAYSVRPLMDRRTEALVYEQGRLLVEFLRSFALDREGRVVLGGSGTYAAGFDRYVRDVFDGRSGSRALRERLALDDVGFARLESEFRAFGAWMLRKIALGQFRDGRPIPWSDAPPRPDGRAPRPEDDLLFPGDATASRPSETGG